MSDQPLPRYRDEDELGRALQELIDQGVVETFRDRNGNVIYFPPKSSREVN